MSIHLVAQLSEVPVGKMLTVKAEGTDILLCNVDGTISALHPKCSHYGAPLADGVLNGHRLVCPWHHACFDARTGRHLEAPGCDAIRSYDVEIKGDGIYVHLPTAAAPNQFPNPMLTGGSPSELPYVVVGAGPAGQHAVEGMRQGGYNGPITLIGAEQHLPYDRTQVSKGFLTGDRPEEKMPLRDADFYETYGVEVLLGKRVEQVDTNAKQIHFEGGQTLPYAKVCICTGSKPRKLDVRGHKLTGVFSVRKWHDAKAIHAAAGKGKKAIVIGSSFIGMEAAMGLATLGCEVTVVSPDKVPFGKTFGIRVGTAVQSWQAANGVKFQLEQEVSAIEGKQKVSGVKLKSGRTLKADLVVIGIGVTPNTAIINGLELDDQGGIPVDQYQHAGKDVWVAGDIATAPSGPDDKMLRIEHWRVAQQQGTIAGNNMAGATRQLMSVPFFWTNQAGKNLRYAGHHSNSDNIIFDGSPEAGSFLAFYIEGDRVAAALGHGRDKALAAIHELMWLNSMPTAGNLNPSCDWELLMQQANS